MFRLLKWAMYTLIGYIVYELYRGFSEHSGEETEPEEQASARLTGRRGSGMVVQSEEASGTSIPHTVGRGVLH